MWVACGRTHSKSHLELCAQHTNPHQTDDVHMQTPERTPQTRGLVTHRQGGGPGAQTKHKSPSETGLVCHHILEP